MDLENTGKEVYYAAPRFHTVDDLNRAYSRQAVFDSSILISPLGVGDPGDDGLHYVAFDQAGTFGGLCSQDFRPIKKLYAGTGFVETEFPRIKTTSSRIDPQFFEKVTDNLVEILDKRARETGRLKEFQMQLKEQRQTISEIAGFAAYLTRLFFDAEMFIVGERG